MQLRGRGFLRGEKDEPTESLTNLADIMLIFAVGIMLFALSRWNVNLVDVSVVRLNQDLLVLVEDLEIMNQATDLQGSSNSSDKAEEVYIDTKTGEMFIFKKDE